MAEGKVIISDQGASFLEKGQTWMYRNNLISCNGCQDGEPADVLKEDGTYLGTGFYSSKSHIAVRILSHDPDEKFDEAFFEKRIAFALDYRRSVEPDNLDNCRLIFGEADGLCGLTVDRYNEILVSQITSSGMEKRKDLIYRILLRMLQKQNVKYLYERNDLASRAKEGLNQYKGFYGEKGPTVTIIHENGLLLNVDVENGQKTGYFLDQKENRMRIRQIAHGKRVLDCFTHTGGFALNAALGKAVDVTAVDVSATALKEAEANAKCNHLEDRVHFVQADVFDYLDSLEKGSFDLIILDPPAFTKSRRTVVHAKNGYRRINEQAMHILKGGGYLATCSCSRYMENALFEQMLKEAARKSGVLLRQISISQQNADHPILWTMDETSYLKFYLFQII